ncbi:MAG: hypothetical protein IJ663_01910 [Spirochaetales bacterium]|nr:hypothetical protein [Spirochaetales bacterium]
MKKILLGLLVIAMVLALTACSQETYAKWAENMGKMGNNVYGIEANMAEVNNATETVSNSVSVSVDNEGNATAEINFSDAAKITESVAKVKDSEQKAEALKGELTKPVVDTSSMTEEEAAKQQEAVKTAIQNQATELSTQVEAKIAEAVAAGATEEQVELLQTVKDTLDSVKESISDTPTMAELATVAVLSEMANTVQEVATAATTEGGADKYVTEEGLTEEGLAIADSALSSLDTLKMTSEVAGMDLLGGVDIMTLINSMSGSKAVNAEVLPYLAAFKGPIATLTKLVTKDGKFNEAMYNSMIAQSKAVKMTYDLLSSLYVNPKTIADCDAVLTAKTKHGLIVDDLLRYFVAMTFVTVDKAGGKAALKEFVDASYNALMDIEANAEELANAPVDGFGDMWNSLLTSLKTQDAYSLRCIATLAILINDTGYTDLLYLGDGDGTISNYLAKL